MEIVSIEFEFEKKTYSALARIKEKLNYKEYHITIMHGELEQTLYGNHIFVEDEDGVVIYPVPENKIGQLRLAVGLALCKYFNKRQHGYNELPA